MRALTVHKGPKLLMPSLTGVYLDFEQAIHTSTLNILIYKMELVVYTSHGVGREPIN